MRYTTLLSAQQGAARLGTVPGPSCAAGLAMDTKQPVHVRDLANGYVAAALSLLALTLMQAAAAEQ